MRIPKTFGIFYLTVRIYIQNVLLICEYNNNLVYSGKKKS